MLNSFRKATDNIVLRLFILLVAIAFIAWGFNGIIGAPSHNIVEFASIEPITRNQLLHSVNQRKKSIRSLNPNISELQIKQIVVQEMIQEKLMALLAKDLNISFDPKTMADFVKKLPYFQNNDNKFDKNKFDSLLQHLGISEQSYFDEINKMLANDLINQTLNNSNYQSSSKIDKLTSFFAEEREVSIITINKNKLSLDNKTNLNNDDLKSFFEKNAEEFREPETRDLKYIVVDSAFFHSKKVLKDLKDQTKLQQLIIEYEKLLEDEVAAGLSIEEIATKLGTKSKLITNTNISKATKIENSGEGIDELGLKIFDLQQDELSYPLILGNNKIILVKIEKINRSFIPEMSKVLDKVKTGFMKVLADQKTKELLDEIHANANYENFYTFAKNPGITLTKNVKLSKNLDAIKIPAELIALIFQAEKNAITPVHIDEKNGYIALVQDIRVSLNAKKDLDTKHIIHKVQEGYLQEIINSLYSLNKVKINYNDPIFKE
jgi:hypothetical protein